MKIPKLPKINLSKFDDISRRLNSPTAYSTYAIIGVLATTALAVIVTRQDCKKKFGKNSSIDILEKQITKEEVVEEIKGTAKVYAPVLISAAATIFCIKKSDQKWIEYNGLINSSYLAAKSQAARYRALAAPAVGAEIAKNFCGQPPEDGVRWFCIEDPRCWKLFYEIEDPENPEKDPNLYHELPKIYFQSTGEDVSDAKYWINRSMALRGSASVREFFCYLGILDQFPEEYEDRLGWDVNELAKQGYDYWIDFDKGDPVFDPSTSIWITPIYYLTDPGYSPDGMQLAGNYGSPGCIYESNFGGPPYRMYPTE